MELLEILIWLSMLLWALFWFVMYLCMTFEIDCGIDLKRCKCFFKPNSDPDSDSNPFDLDSDSEA